MSATKLAAGPNQNHNALDHYRHYIPVFFKLERDPPSSLISFLIAKHGWTQRPGLHTVEEVHHFNMSNHVLNRQCGIENHVPTE
ncbi:hypothetical protein FCV25MIE_12376 [Fagus crenata]